MIYKKIEQVPAFVAGDKTILKELLHPNNDSLDIPYSLAHAKILAGSSSVPHILKSKELYFILEGEGEILIEDERQTITKGDLIMVPANAKQSVENIGEVTLEFLVIVSPPWQEEEEEIL